MKKINLCLAIASIFLIITSCDKDEFENNSEIKTNNISNYSQDTKIKTKIAKALSNAVAENQVLREFLKAEALKKITKDYDVLYNVVKNQNINSGSLSRSANSVTLHNLLLPYFENEQELIDIERQLPLLTIFIPDLQEGSFSAQNWNTSSQIPLVAVRSYESDDVMCYGTNIEFKIDAEYMPDFPVIVIKDNERVISNVTASQYNNLATNIISVPSDEVQIRFIDDNYDASIINVTTNTNVNSNSLYPRVDIAHQNAFNAFNNYTPGGWQRDNIYYGLTPINTSGGINPTFREYLTSFKLTGNPQATYSKISSSQDPQLRSLIPRNRSAWTDGAFEIGIKLSYGAKNSNLGTEIKKGFSATPNELFEITYISIHPYLANFGFKKAIISGLKMIDFINNPNYKIEFSVWDLNNYSNQWKIEFEEIDVPTTFTNTVSATNKFNMNFSLEPSTGILKKIGLKFGASLEQSQTNTYVTQYTDISDDLKHSDINFYDNVVDLNSSNQLVPRKYNTGFVEFEFRPRLVY